MHFAPQKNGFNAGRLNFTLQAHKCLNNPRHGNARTESASSASMMQNVSFASIPEHTLPPASPPVAVRTVPPKAPHNNSSDNSPKSSDTGAHNLLR